ncbi:phytoene desaturase family protein [Propionibacteriaceae bacterium Y2011]|uniref:phytoene desaturase family protein n=1 Tax=Microlunatus sp. Y2014 TaxID=3418488 RepID=UPI003B4ACB57
MAEPDQVFDAIVVGGSLAGLAAAVRLAKNRHRVLLLEAADRLGGRLAPYRLTPGPSGKDADGPGSDVEVDDWPGMITFPAPWRDLFRKSGRTFDDELARADQALVPAPAPRHEFADGGQLVMPADRGLQYTVLSQAYGTAIADRWRDLVDHLDQVWQVLRPLGGEAELVDADQLRAKKAVLQPGRTVADLAKAIDHPHLAAMINLTAWQLGSDPRRTPGWCAVSLSTERRFGRWMMTTGGRPDRTSTLLDRLVDRVGQRRIRVELDTTVTSIDALGPDPADPGDRHRVTTTAGTFLGRTVILATQPWEGLPLLGRAAAVERRALGRTRPALAPLTSHEVNSTADAAAAADVTPDAESEPTETIRHTDRGPVISWTRPLADGRIVTSTHDWTRARPDPGAGVAWRGARTALRRPPIRSTAAGVFLAGPHSRGGADLPHTVLSGALASYAAHDLLADQPVG